MWILSYWYLAPELLLLVKSFGGVVSLRQATVLTHQKCELWARYSNGALNLVHVFAKLNAG